MVANWYDLVVLPCCMFWIVLGISVGIFKLFNFGDKPYKGKYVFLALSSRICYLRNTLIKLGFGLD
ncbi:hypothetical protein IFVP177_C1320199 [Vibrio parahaemolyticus]